MRKVVTLAALGITLITARDAAAQFTFGIGFSCNKVGGATPGAGILPFNYYYPGVPTTGGTTGTFNAIVPGNYVFVPANQNTNNGNGAARGIDPSAQPDLVTAINNLTAAVNNLASKMGGQPAPGGSFNAIPPTVPAPAPMPPKKNAGGTLPRQKEIDDMFAQLESPRPTPATGTARR